LRIQKLQNKLESSVRMLSEANKKEIVSGLGYRLRV
jgi:hypothetical protein